MTRRHTRSLRSTRDRFPSKRRRPWGYLVCFILGFATATLIWVHPYFPHVSQRHIASPTSSHTAHIKHAPESDLKFDFYTILPQSNPRSGGTFVASSAQGGYFLKNTTLLDKSHAEALKAQLSLLGFSVTVYQELDSESAASYRVSIGPYRQLSTAKTEKRRLSQRHIFTTIKHKSIEK